MNIQVIVAAVILAFSPLAAIASYTQPHVVGDKIYFPGNAPSQKSSIESLGKTRSPSANACGVAKAAITASNPWTTFTYNGQTYQLVNLPIYTKPSVCAKVGGSYILYIPQTP
ncbi:MAG TPA: hypothetical protein VK211_29135 [Kamptonema sp.]|nr:hypothetical protein [Kamptonema sp.]